jgi:hypothetical protein
MGVDAADCTSGCCAKTSRRTAGELFERGFRRARQPALPIAGPTYSDPDGLHASFSLDVADGMVSAVRFRAATCATLMAYCELLVELAQNGGLAAAAGITSEQLVAEVAGVPAMRMDRAALAMLAFRAALAHAASLTQRAA